MKLSEAIRKGAALVPEQAFGDYFYVNTDITAWPKYKVCAVCVLGAAYIGYLNATEGASPEDAEDAYADLNLWKWLQDTFDVHEAVLFEMRDWNDDLKLTREEIAARLEGNGR